MTLTQVTGGLQRSNFVTFNLNIKERIVLSLNPVKDDLLPSLNYSALRSLLNIGSIPVLYGNGMSVCPSVCLSALLLLNPWTD